MDEKGVKIVYGNYAINSQAAFTPRTDDDALGTSQQLKDFDFKKTNFGNPLEFCNVPLDGKSMLIPTAVEDADIGFWSNQISSDNGEFETPVTIEFVTNKIYSVKGLVLVFDEFNGIYPTNINVAWYQDKNQIKSADYAPTSARFVLKERAERFNKIVLTIKKLNMPNNRFKLLSIQYGYDEIIPSKNIKSASLFQELDPVSNELSINTGDFKIVYDDADNFLFQKKQPLFVYFDEQLKASMVVSKFERTAINEWALDAEDFISLLDNVEFEGGIFVEEPAKNIFSRISEKSMVQFIIDDAVGEMRLSGYIPYTTCRNALLQTCFACGAVADTSNSFPVKIYTLSEDISQQIGFERILTNPKYEQEDDVTAVELTYYQYDPIDEEVELYNGQKDGIKEGGKEVKVVFDEPIHDLVKEGVGSLYEFGTNYAILYANRGTILKGKRYRVARNVVRMDNDEVLSNSFENVVKVQDATLVSPSNVDKLSRLCYNYYKKSFSAQMKIAERKSRDIIWKTHKYGESKYGAFKYGLSKSVGVGYKDADLNVGDLIQFDTLFDEKKTGRIISERYTLNGGIIVKDCKVR